MVDSPDPALPSVFRPLFQNEGEDHLYRGGMSGDMRHGFGIMEWPDGRSYEGEWSEDVMHGVGTYHPCFGRPPHLTLFVNGTDMKRKLRLEMVSNQPRRVIDILDSMQLAKLPMREQLIFYGKYSAVHVCARLNQWPMCDAILSFCEPSDVQFLLDMPEESGASQTPLEMACRWGHVEFVQNLLSSGCRIDFWKSNFGRKIMERTLEKGSCPTQKVRDVELCIELIEKWILWVRRRFLILLFEREPWSQLDIGLRRHLARYL